MTFVESAEARKQERCYQSMTNIGDMLHDTYNKRRKHIIIEREMNSRRCGGDWKDAKKDVEKLESRRNVVNEEQECENVKRGSRSNFKSVNMTEATEYMVLDEESGGWSLKKERRRTEERRKPVLETFVIEDSRNEENTEGIDEFERKRSVKVNEGVLLGK